MKPILSAFFCVLIASLSWGQKYDKAFLQKQNRELQAEIQKLNKVLAQAKKESNNSLVYVVALNDKIKKREAYIQNAKKEKRFIEDDIYLKQLEINKYNRELADLRKDYGEVLVTAYKNKTVQNKMMFVLSAKDFGQAFRRIKYLQLYSDYQDNKAEEIKAKIAAIEKLKSSREKDIQEKKTLLARQESEIQKLEQEKVEKNKVAQEFKKNEKSIIAQIRAKEAQQNKLDAQIQLAIEEEIRIAKKKEAERKAKLEAEQRERERLAKLEAERKEKERLAALSNAEKRKEEVAAKKAEKEASIENVSDTKVVSSTPEKVEIPKSEYEKLSDDFEANKGKLPNPMPGSVVVSHYGSHDHPYIDGLKVNNKGVDISSPNGIVKAIFNGKVMGIQKVDGNLKAVLVSHGEYYSVYTNIDDSYVKQGDNVKTGQDIGHVFVNDENRSVSKIMIYKDTQKQNPEEWVRFY